VKTLDTQVRPGAVLIYVSLHDAVIAKTRRPRGRSCARGWRMCNPSCQREPSGPTLNDDFGRVAVRTIAITGDGYDAAKLELWAKHVRNQLQSVSGVAAISLHGVRREMAYVDLNPEAVRAAGTSVAAVAKALQERDQLSATGQLIQGGTSIAVQTGDRPGRVSDLAAFPSRSATAPWCRSARSARSARPAGSAPGRRILQRQARRGAGRLDAERPERARLCRRTQRTAGRDRPTLPAGLHADNITDQATVVEKELKKVGQVFVETVVIVLGVVMLFLGWRSGLVTGTIVPMTVLGTALVMNWMGIELHQISIAAIIIALGIFVDNGIVVVEDYQRRISEGEDAPSARAAGETMLMPLLVSSLAIIVAFVPLVAGDRNRRIYAQPGHRPCDHAAAVAAARAHHHAAAGDALYPRRRAP
jgi:hypothetical protein